MIHAAMFLAQSVPGPFPQYDPGGSLTFWQWYSLALLLGWLI